MRSEGLPEEFVAPIPEGWWTTCLEVLPAKERRRVGGTYRLFAEQARATVTGHSANDLLEMVILIPAGANYPGRIVGSLVLWDGKMPQAKSLSDLFRIRAHNREYLDAINGNLGTALGFKHRTGQSALDEPAVIVFVPEKIHRKWIQPNQLLATELKGPGSLKCPLDVVAGGKASEEQPVPDSGTALAQRLRGWDDRIWCGSQISSSRSGTVTYGTLGAFVKRKSNGLLGFLTNDHVAIGNTMWYPWAPGSPGFPSGTTLIGSKEQSIVEKGLTEWYGDFAAESAGLDFAVRVDCSFISTSLKQADVSPQPLVEEPYLKPASWGPVFEIDLEGDMTDRKTGFIGADVYRVGRTTGLRKGTIAAFAYEWQDQPSQKRYADLLIAGETRSLATGLEMSIPFSYKGDSGSIVFMERGAERRPLALLWGGFQEQLRGGDSQENWSYATRLDKILDSLDLSLVTDTAAFPV